MKRPPEFLLLSAVLLGVIFHYAIALRGTQLVFRKTTTTSTEAVPEAERRKDEEAAEATEVPETTVSSTPKSNLTGIPQLDYIYDPNLPRELNGYNLSSYPFYNGLPEDINFKCDGLHDGFYASVVHKCQVYHHCLFGTRFDFLCANYTAFDQKTFICHFVSEVDCVNSPKFWHRNDALYQAATTTSTAKPTPIVVSPALTAVPRKPHAGVRRPKPSRKRPQYDYYDDEYDDDESKEEYYEEPPRRRRKRPRPRRPRPIYDDEYEDYEDERYDRRSSGRKPYNRRPHDSDRDDPEEGRSKTDRRKPNDYKGRDEEPPYNKEDDSRHETRDERRPNENKHRNGNGKNHPDGSVSENRGEEGSRINDDRRTDDRRTDDRRTDDRRTDDRRPDDRRTDDRRVKGDSYQGDEDRRVNKHKPDDRRPDYDDRDDESYRFDRDRRKGDRRRRPIDDEIIDEDRPRLKPSYNNRDYSDRRPLETASSFDRPRKIGRKPYDDILHENDDKDDRRSFDRPLKSNKNKDRTLDDDEPIVKNKPRNEYDPEKDEKVLIKPNSGSSVFNQPRAPPRIKPPVPKNEQNKYSYKSSTEKQVVKVPEKDEEYYDDYEDEPVLSSRFKDSEKKVQSSSTEKQEPIDNKRTIEPNYGRSKVQQPYKQPTTESSIEYSENKPRPRQPLTKPNYENRQSYLLNYQTQKPKPAVEEKIVEPSVRPKNNFYNNRESVRNYREKNEIEVSSTAAPLLLPPRDTQPVVKVVKRPFLPSRGGNPYAPRGLQPVGSRSLNVPVENQDTESSSIVKNVNIETLEPKQRDNYKTIGEEEYTNSEDNLNPIEYNKQSSAANAGSEATENYKNQPYSENVQNAPQTEFSKPTQNEQEETRPASNRPETVLRQRPYFNDYDTNEKEKTTSQEKNPLDIIDEDEYDVTLNDALSPTLPNLPLRSFRSPYSVSTDYTFRNFQRPTSYNAAPTQTADNTFQVRSSSQRVENVAKPQADNARKRYSSFRSQGEETYDNQNFRPHSQITQAQTRAFYPVY